MWVLGVVPRPVGRSCCGRAQGDCLKTAATEALALNCKDNRIIKDAVKSTQERVVLTEIFLLLRRIAVAGEDHVVITVLLVTAVHHVKEQLRVLLAKFAVSHFINNKA